MKAPRRHLRIALAAAVAALVLVPSSAAPQAPAEPAPAEADALRARFQGRWALALSRDEANAVVDRAVEQAVSAMSFFVRGIARPRLREGTSVNERIELRFAGEELTVRFSDGDRYTTRVGETARRQNADGEALTVTQRFRASGQLEQVFAGDGGTRWYVYTPIGADRVRVEVTTDSPRMPRPMYFTLDYERR